MPRHRSGTDRRHGKRGQELFQGNDRLYPYHQDSGANRCAVRAGAQLGTADTKTLEDLTVYAENLGLAFQICDDILDVVGEEERMGKKTGADAQNKKATYPALFGLEESKERLDELTDTAIEALEDYYDNAEIFVKLAKILENRGN